MKVLLHKIQKVLEGMHVNKFSKEDIVKALVSSKFKILKIKKSHLGMLITVEAIKVRL